MKCKIKSMDHTGDSILATYDPEVSESVTIADEALQAFMDGCIAEHGEPGKAFARLPGARDFNPFDPKTDDLTEVDEVVLHQPLVGG